MDLEFCPRCFHPFDPCREDDDGDDRLCSTCQWFGDKTEVCLEPPKPTPNEQAFLQVVDFYREICHGELQAAQLCEKFPEHKKKLEYIQRQVEHGRHCLLYMFRIQHT